MLQSACETTLERLTRLDGEDDLRLADSIIEFRDVLSAYLVAHA
jgi:hypothetical protein